MRSLSSRVCAVVLALSGILPAMGDRGTPERRIGLDEWKDGWSMLVGAGVSRSRYVTDDKHVEQSGVGPNLATSVGYCNYSSCLEIGSIVSFDSYDNVQVRTGPDTLVLDSWMWETALFLALRTRLPGIQSQGQFNPWIKLLTGYGASVGYPQRFVTPGCDSLKDRRIQDEGPLFGLSLSNVFGEGRPGRLWFLEGTAILQLHWNSWIVRSGGLLPDVQSSFHSSGNPYSVLLSLSIGIRAF